jgi:hypothetical protein
VVNPLYFILEHPTRGTVREVERTPTGIKVRFRTAGTRADEENMQFLTTGAAQRMLNGIKEETPKLASEIRIRRQGDWRALCPDCGRWCETWYDHAKPCPVYQAEIKAHGR